MRLLILDSIIYKKIKEVIYLWSKFLILHVNVKTRLLDQFLRNLAFNMITPFMTIYFAGYLGAFNAGLILMINLVLSFILGLYGGHLADRLGRRKILLWSGSIRLIATSGMAIAVSPWVSSPILVLSMVTLNSLCIGVARPVGSAMIADSSHPDDRKFIYTIDYWLFNLSMVIGAILGGFFFQHYLYELLLGVAFSAFVSLLLITFLIKDTYLPHKKKERVKTNPLREVITIYRGVLKDNVFRIFILANLMNISVQTQTMDYIAVRLKEEMASQTLFTIGDFSFVINGINMFGLLYSVNSFLVITFGLFIAQLFKRLSSLSLLNIGLLLYTMGLTTLAVSNNPYLLIFSEVLIVVGELMYIPIKQSLMIDIIPQESRGAYMATNEFAILGAMVMGALAVSLGALFPSWFMASLFFVCGITSIFLFGRLPNHQHNKNKAELKAS
ncbi:MFS transporter, DHA1 family, multidrug resistance protein B [Thermoactinomyces sp. DSM 45891]|uniref:MFS transporter n=1 Tax=Thermoactinomyces sp. DSM 45891 TaxID=1761907 RepID=UPI0009236199|nr:MFS transporter [Thermoactinomyces sp. DSM 45891]SFX35919.1 MFS transporter, DHA1 family, multidrug resistance protein B [Thermoactinomyces sp. DSM 45891]